MFMVGGSSRSPTIVLLHKYIFLHRSVLRVLGMVERGRATDRLTRVCHKIFVKRYANQVHLSVDPTFSGT